MYAAWFCCDPGEEKGLALDEGAGACPAPVPCKGGVPIGAYPTAGGCSGIVAGIGAPGTAGRSAVFGTPMGADQAGTYAA
jgi:hypothetical protein